MALLFEKDTDTIGLHLKNIYETRKLDKSERSKGRLNFIICRTKKPRHKPELRLSISLSMFHNALI